MVRLPAAVRRALPGLFLATFIFAAGSFLTGVPEAAAAVIPGTTAGATNQGNSGFVDKSGTDTSMPGQEYVLTPKTSETALQPLIGRIASLLVGISGSLALLVFVWAGITMMRANGDAKLIQKAKDMMVWTAIGLLVIFASEAIIRAVLNALLKGSAA
jgi:hypothetical protein